MKKIFFLAFAALATLQAAAQWRIGANVGGMYNHYVIDKHYFDDYQYKDRWGVGFGLMGQYDILDWLGVRAELDYVQKNHQVQRTLEEVDYSVTNTYLQLPVMASTKETIREYSIELEINDFKDEAFCYSTDTADFYFEAYFKIHKMSSLNFIQRQLISYEDEMTSHCIGSIPELFDGNPPFRGRGAVSFALNVAEILRSLYMLSKYNL